MAVRVDFVNHIHYLRFRWILPESSHDGPKLLGCDGIVSILVIEHEAICELRNLVIGQLVRHSYAQPRKKTTAAGTIQKYGVGEEVVKPFSDSNPTDVAQAFPLRRAAQFL